MKLVNTVLLALGFVVLAVPAPAQTPKDPKSPVPGLPDGRGPSGPVSLKIAAPKPDEVIPIPPAEAGQPAATGAPVEVRVQLTGYETFQDPATKAGQYVALMLDNYPTVFAYYDVAKPWLFKRIPKGTHFLRAFPVRPWGESIKEDTAFASVTFSVGEKDGRNVNVDGAPILTVDSPRGKVRSETGRVLLDFNVTGCNVTEKGAGEGSCRVRYKIDTEKEVTLAREDAVWLVDVTPGRHAWVVGITRDEKIVPGPYTLAQGSFDLETANPAAPPAAPPGKATGQ
ncbi:MAG TPA: hypothetical protein VMN04_04320 [Thermoanaerobaculia bacterium]|nr:hypothetical protein [Thermoanaerobaculia bacterium]